jgi:hypothetical protein
VGYLNPKGFQNPGSCSGMTRFADRSGALRPRGCTYSIFLEIDRIWYAAEFVHLTGIRFACILQDGVSATSSLN